MTENQSPEIVQDDAVDVDIAGGADIAVDPASPATGESRHRRQMTGVVVSTKMEKTAVISVTRIFLHPKYRKYVRRRAKYMAHDEHGKCGMGDQVVIEECRPMSAHKRWVYKTTLRKKAD